MWMGPPLDMAALMRGEYGEIKPESNRYDGASKQETLDEIVSLESIYSRPAELSAEADEMTEIGGFPDETAVSRWMSIEDKQIATNEIELRKHRGCRKQAAVLSLGSIGEADKEVRTLLLKL
jgi:hypothetical protein